MGAEVKGIPVISAIFAAPFSAKPFLVFRPCKPGTRFEKTELPTREQKSKLAPKEGRKKDPMFLSIADNMAAATLPTHRSNSSTTQSEFTHAGKSPFDTFDAIR